MRTLAARSIAGFTTMEDMFEQRAPFTGASTQADCGAAAAYLLSDDAKNVTGTTLYVDAGYHAMGKKAKKQKKKQHHTSGGGGEPEQPQKQEGGGGHRKSKGKKR